jgi:hypothetical protein
MVVTTKPDVGPQRLRWVAGPVIGVAFALTAVAVVPSIRMPILGAVGSALVVDEPVGPADIIVLSPDSGGAGALEAADLWNAVSRSKSRSLLILQAERIGSSSVAGSPMKMRARGKFGN